MNKISSNNIIIRSLTYTMRVGILLSVVFMFFPGLNPSRISVYINKTMSLFTSAVSYKGLIKEAGRSITRGWVDENSFIILFLFSIVLCIGIGVSAAGACLSVGNLKCRFLANRLTLSGSLVQIIGLAGIYWAYVSISTTKYPEKVEPQFAGGYYWFLGIAILVIITSILQMLITPKPDKNMPYEIERKYRLFLMFLPFVALIFVFSYLPLYGWRFAFFDYKAGGTLTLDKFVGFKWFTYLFENAATRRDIVRVLRNTLVMSGLGIVTSWVPLAFAIFLSDVSSTRFKRAVQIFTTIPNFISWVLVYSLALAIFSTDGFINSFFMNLGIIKEAKNYLMGESYTWLKMLAWGMWKTLGWSAIIYIASISSIDPQLYEAAKVDGAGRFQRMLYITVPSLMSTYFVLLVMSIAAILSNGMDQYYVFENANNTYDITVLDLHVYQLGIENGVIPLSTVIGMLKSIISIILLFFASRISKQIRGQSIV